MSAYDALMNHSRKHMAMYKRKPKNNRPEKVTERAVMQWLGENGFSCHVVEAKATYNHQAGRYLSGPVEAGFPDIVGCDPHGLGVFIELKAFGRRACVSEGQAYFLKEKIDMGAFAIVVDKVEYLEACYIQFLVLKPEQRKEYLRKLMPVKKARSAENQKSSDL